MAASGKAIIDGRSEALRLLQQQKVAKAPPTIRVGGQLEGQIWRAKSSSLLILTSFPTTSPRRSE